MGKRSPSVKYLVGKNKGRSKGRRGGQTDLERKYEPREGATFLALVAQGGEVGLGLGGLGVVVGFLVWVGGFLGGVPGKKRWS